MASETVLAFLATVLPPRSWMVTTGWVPNLSPATVVPGGVVKDTCAAGPTAT